MSKKCHFQYFQYRQKNVKKMSGGPKNVKNMSKNVLGNKKKKLKKKMSRRIKNILKMFFILQDIFLTFFWNFFWPAGHFFDIFLAVLEILEMTFFRHFFGIFELVQPNRLGPTQNPLKNHQKIFKISLKCS